MSAAIAAIPAGVAVWVAYGAELLARADYDTAAAAPEARRVGLTVVACCLAAAALRALLLLADRRLERVKLPRYARVGFVVGTLAVLVAGALAVGAPGAGHATPSTRSARAQYLQVDDLRDRLTSAVDNGRIEHWQVALDGVPREPLHGTGAGHVPDHVGPRAPTPVQGERRALAVPRDAVGARHRRARAARASCSARCWSAAALRLRGEERHAHAFVVAGGAMLALHAGVDWDWEMPALFVWFFAAGGVVLAARTPRLGELGRTPRIVAALAVLVLAITPALFWWSQGPLDDAGEAWNARDCPTAIDRALTATERFGTRPEPWLLLAYCDTRLGDYTLARAPSTPLAQRDPNNWQVAYAQAIVYGVSGADPLPYAGEALRLNPLETYTQQLVEDLRAAKTEARRREVAGRALIPPYGY